MARNKLKEKASRENRKSFDTKLRVGDPVMVLTGGNSSKAKVVKGEVGKILRFIPKKARVVVERVNMVKRHKRAMTSTDTAGIVDIEGSVHISNVLYYNEELKRPVRLKHSKLADGRKVRGYINPKTKKFEQTEV
jgi:large subunit ribosomal protein L24